MKKYFLAPLLLAAVACSDVEKATSPLFQKLSPDETGIDFTNTLQYDDEFNIFTYRNYYNGGGVGMADVNNDGLVDLYLTGNRVPNKLYLNKGNLQFEDITEKAGVAGDRAWSTGVSMADVNGDGLIDIYVCNSGDIAGDNKQNELFINNGDLTFTESAEEYGLADRGFSTHAAFFDYDKDGDLDAYLLNNSYRSIGSFNRMQNERPVRDEVGGDKLYRNDGNKFVDVSEEAGIYGSVIGFGLGITVGDVNQDGWQDIFISNDFFERDYLYINNQDGTFSETLESSMRSISAASMGADIADINNDSRPDIFVTDMLPEPDQRLKQVTTFENWDKHIFNYQNSYHYQFTRNMLHLNNGNGTFSEIGRLSGVEATDWSWGALLFDMDNDGLKDLFVANGIYQDITDLDYLNFIDSDETKREVIKTGSVNYRILIDPIPVNPIPNYAYQNQGDLKFENKAEAWGLGEPVHSNGSAYADLDNDGDLELIVNNVNREAFIYENKANEVLPENRFLKVKLEGKTGNTRAIGANVLLKKGDNSFFQEQMPIRGFQSTVDAALNFGVKDIETMDEVIVTWPDGRVTRMANVSTNQTLELKWEEAKEIGQPSETPKEAIFAEVSSENILPFQHDENTFVDFNRDRLTYHMLSNEGPKLTIGDINGDGLDDIFLGGAKEQAGQTFLQSQNGNYKKLNNAAFEADANSEDTDAAFIDVDKDGDLDLFVASGGNEFGLGVPELADRLYLNDGNGNFSKSDSPFLNRQRNSTSVVRATDINGDGNIDLFVGTRVRPFLYGVPADSYLYLGDGNGGFTDASAEIASELSSLGLVTDAVWSDVDGDQDQDLLVVGEWMAPTLFVNDQGKLTKKNDLDAYSGWYNSITAADIDGDGDMDFVIGNHGQNSRFKASVESPVKLYVNDFDQNGSAEHIFTRNIEGRTLPFTLKHELEMQIPSVKKKYLKYQAYNDQALEDIFSPEQLVNAVVSSVTFLSTAVMMNDGNGNFEIKALPVEAQFSPTYAVAVYDFNKDGHQDLVLGGNLDRAKPQVGKYDAQYGLLLAGDGQGGFTPVEGSGLNFDGEVRDFGIVNSGNSATLLVIRNNDTPQVFKF